MVIHHSPVEGDGGELRIMMNSKQVVRFNVPVNGRVERHYPNHNRLHKGNVAIGLMFGWVMALL